MLPGNHLHGIQGCLVCNKQQSKTEKQISKLLTGMGIEYTEQKKFEGCRHILPLSFDFFLPSINTLIEYDGEQHFLPIRGDANLKLTKLRDSIKDQYAFDNNFKLIRIPYWKKSQIHDILSETIKTE